MVTVVGVSRGHYEEVSSRYAKSYVWCPDSVMVECECGARAEFTGVDGAVCGCGLDLSSVIEERLESRMRVEVEVEVEEYPWHPGTGRWKEYSEQDYEEELAEVDRVREE